MQLLDKRWRRRAIGVVSGSSNDTAQPLLASAFYLTRALAPFADVRLGDRVAAEEAFAQFLDQKVPWFVLADVVLPDDPGDAVTPLHPAHDTPSGTAEQLGWLRQAGFAAHVTWKRRDLAVFVADEPGARARPMTLDRRSLPDA